MPIWTELDRFQHSANRSHSALIVNGCGSAQRQMISDAKFGSVRFRVTIPRDQPTEIILTIEPFTPPAPALINAGVRCVTAPGLMRRNPSAKTTDWMTDRSNFEIPSGIYEALLVADNGRVLEGFSSNFYGIKDNELRTAGEDVLPGIAQLIVFTVAPQLIVLRRDALHQSELSSLSEAFITSSSRGIIPVIEIDGEAVGDGAPGPRTMAIRRAYNHWVEAHLEEL